MSRCFGSIRKHRCSTVRNKQPNDYKHGMRGHAWKKLFQDGEHIGRKCTKCSKQVLNFRGKLIRSTTNV